MTRQIKEWKCPGCRRLVPELEHERLITLDIQCCGEIGDSSCDWFLSDYKPIFETSLNFEAEA